MNFSQKVLQILDEQHNTTPKKATTKQLYDAVSKAAMLNLKKDWKTTPGQKRACYLSAEFLIGRLVYANLMNLGLAKECEDLFIKEGIDLKCFEEIEDDALGNGGLGRLAACFLDSAASHHIPLDGFGIRYRYGLFKQYFDNGFQGESADDWQSFGDPWSVRKEDEAVTVSFRNQQVKAIPYDMPVIGYQNGCVNTLRLWQAEPINGFNFHAFNDLKYDEAVKEANDAENINAVLYPNDNGYEGRVLRLKQQYFFSSATMQTLVNRYTAEYGENFSAFADCYAVQLNDTHPTISIPELIRILCEDYLLTFEEAFEIAQKTFAYTNHTIMAEALEKWDVSMILDVIPQVYPYIVMLHNRLSRELKTKNITSDTQKCYHIIADNQVQMARMAVYASHSTNGVAQIHTEILKNEVLHEWYMLYPQRFNNKTNGITQRRWLALCNKELSNFITEHIGDKWITDLDELKKMQTYVDDETALNTFMQIKSEKKRQLCDYIKAYEGVEINPNFIFDVQIKRLHEYKRQLLNAFSILDTYYGIKDGRIKDFTPTVYLFGAKAAPGYFRAKGIIKYINEIAKMIAVDPEMKDKMQVLFVHNYNVSYAEKLIPAADISEQISTAGTEASGTGNMKFMLNGAVTMGTMDGANIEIVEQAGRENNYIFGAEVDEIAAVKSSYNPRNIYNNNPRIKRVLDTLIDGTFDDCGSGMFAELYHAILDGASWHQPDHYFLLLDFERYCDARMQANRDYKDKKAFAKKCFINMANAGKFSSDRTIKQYAEEIWF